MSVSTARWRLTPTRSHLGPHHAVLEGHGGRLAVAESRWRVLKLTELGVRTELKSHLRHPSDRSGRIVIAASKGLYFENGAPLPPPPSRRPSAKAAADGEPKLELPIDHNGRLWPHPALASVTSDNPRDGCRPWKRGAARGACPAAVSSRPPVTPRCPLAPGGGQAAVRLRSGPQEPETALPAEPSSSSTPLVSPVMDPFPKVAWWPAVRAPGPTASAPPSRDGPRAARRVWLHWRSRKKSI